MEKIKKALEKMTGVIFEQSGSWLWISGNTLEHKEELKGLKCRWSAKRKKWYWKPEKAEHDNVIDVSGTGSEYGGVISDGYLGATRWDGSNSHKGLFGAELSKAIRAEFKKCNIKNVTVACKTFTGGQEIKISITPAPGDLKTFEEYAAAKNSCRNFNQFAPWDWVHDYTNNKDVHICDIDKLPEEEKARIYSENIKKYYSEWLAGDVLNLNRGPEVYKDIFTQRFIDKLALIKKIVDSFNYDDSNSMVDYFDRGFYEDYYLKEVKGA